LTGTGFRGQAELAPDQLVYSANLINDAPGASGTMSHELLA